MTRISLLAVLASLCASPSLASLAGAQCLDWRNDFSYASDGIPTGCKFHCLATHDDGTGPALYAGGQFTNLSGSGDTNNVARWTGAGWQPLDNGAWWTDTNGVRAICSFDDGSGSALYIGGWYDNNGFPVPSSVMRWNGVDWVSAGAASGRVSAFIVFDDGSGPALYGIGYFEVGTVRFPAAKWTGTTWAVLDGGIQIDTVGALSAAVFDDGSGPALYVGSIYSTDGTVKGVAKWTGSSWLQLGSGFGPGNGQNIKALLAHDDGTGPALYAGGTFTTADGGGANHIARWNGTSWSPLLAGTGAISGSVADVYALARYDTGGGPELYVGGLFTTAGGAPASRIAKWSQGVWSTVGTGIHPVESNGTGVVESLLVHDQGTGPELFVGGVYTGAGGQAANGLAHWDGGTWSATGGSGQGIPSNVRALEALDLGSGPELWAGGEFAAAGAALEHRVARWNGTGWSSVVAGVSPPSPVQALAALRVSGVTEVYAGGGSFGTFTLARLSAQGWVTVPSYPNNTVYAMETFDDGGGARLYVGGAFNIAGAVNLGGIGRFDGANWSPMGSGMNGAVLTIAVFDDGSGAKVYAGGAFTTAGGVPANYVARWNGTSWSALGSGTNSHVLALAVFDEGGGPALYAGGAFTLAGGNSASNVARWNGTDWTALGSGTNALVDSLAVLDDGSGQALYAGGEFTSAGGVSANRVAKWKGASWSALGSGVNNSVLALASFDDGAGGGPDLFVGGAFTSAGALESSRIAVWEGCGATNQTFCFGDGSLTACPCANSGLPGHGCRNSAASRGAELTPLGTSIPDSLVLSVGFEPATALSIFLQGDALIPAGTFFGDGLRCTGGNLKRLYAKNASGGLVAAPTGADLPISARSAALGDVIPPGATRYYQVYYRDPDPSFCPAPAGATFNVSNGARILW